MEKEVDDLGVVKLRGTRDQGQREWDDNTSTRGPQPYLDESPDHPQAREPQILEGPSFAHGVQERVEVQGNVRWQGSAARQMIDPTL